MRQPSLTAASDEARKPRLTDQKRAAIVHAAVAEFQARGFDGTSMDQIAARADVSKRTVYNHFPSKEDLFHEIVAELTARSEPTESFSFDNEGTLEEQLATIGATIIDAMAGDDFINLARVVLSRFLQRARARRQDPEGAQAVPCRAHQVDRDGERRGNAERRRSRPGGEAVRRPAQFVGILAAGAGRPTCSHNCRTRESAPLHGCDVSRPLREMNFQRPAVGLLRKRMR